MLFYPLLLFFQYFFYLFNEFIRIERFYYIIVGAYEHAHARPLRADEARPSRTEDARPARGDESRPDLKAR